MDTSSHSNNVIQDYFSQEVINAEKAYFRLKQKMTTKDVYALRVALRRIKTVIHLLETNGITPLTKEQKRILKRVWKTLGKQRDADVAKKTARTMSIDSAEIKKTRKDLRHKTSKVIEKEDLGFLLKSMSRMERLLTPKKINPAKAIQKLQTELRKDFKDNSEDLHQFRILLKKVRYLLALFGKENKTFKSYQDIFGLLNDLKNFHHYGGKHKAIKSAWNHQKKICMRALPDARKLALIELNRLKRSQAKKV